MVSLNISRKKSATRRHSRAMSVGRTPNAYKKGLKTARMLGHRSNVGVIRGMVRGLKTEAANAKVAASLAAASAERAARAKKFKNGATARNAAKVAKATARAATAARAHARAAVESAAAAAALVGSTRRARK